MGLGDGMGYKAFGFSDDIAMTPIRLHGQLPGITNLISEGGKVSRNVPFQWESLVESNKCA